MTHAPHILALSDGWTIGIFVVNSLLTVLLAFATLWVGVVARRAERRAERFEQTAEQLVAEKFRSAKAEVTGLIARLQDANRRIEERLQSGDRFLTKLAEQDHAVELKFVQAVEQLHRTIVDTFAKKTEVDALARKVEAMAIGKVRT